MIQKNQLRVTLQNRSGILADEVVSALTSINSSGVFDVLPNHANFISLIKDYIILHHSSKENKEYKFTQGVMEVRNNKVNIYLDVLNSF